jgi:hypothetical protein
MVVDLPAGADREEAARRLLEGDVEVELDGPPAFEARPGANPHTP